MKRILTAVLVCTVAAHTAAPRLRAGMYRGVLLLDTATELPFNFEVKYVAKKPRIVIRNADERIVADEIRVTRDSVNFRMPGFDTEFRCARHGDDFSGVWINHYRTTKNVIRFSAKFGETRRFLFTPGKGNPVLDGRWEVTFSPRKPDSTKAVGIFSHIEQTDYLKGTFLTETGDYRYLEGMYHEGRMLLSCFDGSHAFLFDAFINTEGVLGGTFYSGAHWREHWIAWRNPSFKLREGGDITPFDSQKIVGFSFADTDGKMVSLNDERFRNKPVIVQVMGSWCPNCMDESKLLSDVWNKNSANVGIVALAFEKTADTSVARRQARRMKERLGIHYPVLITGMTGREQASQALPSLRTVTAFPTTLFLGRDHRIVYVETGFNGPATGEEYEKTKRQIESIIKRITSN